MGQLTDEQLHTIVIIERTTSAISFIGCVFVITTFIFFKPFREKPVNRLVFYASFGNMATDIGTLMTRSFLADTDSVGCQMQAMLIQWFMPADAGWVLAMAINVYLTVYRNYDVKRLHKMEPLYFLVCYGTPFIPAFIYLFLRHNGQRVYGDAKFMGCFIVKEFAFLRIATFYAPVWIMIFITFAIYIRTACTIFKIRKQVHQLSSDFDDSFFQNYEISTTNGSGLETTTIAPHDVEYPACVLDANHDSEPGSPGSPALSQDSSKPIATVQVAAHAQQVSTQQHFARRHSFEHKNAAWSYSKCALLYFVAFLIVWIPSTANRVYSLVHNGALLAPMAYASAFVAPMQGFWNCLIYIVMSWAACKQLMRNMTARGCAICGQRTMVV